MNLFANMLNNLKQISTPAKNADCKLQRRFRKASERLPKIIRGIQNEKIVDDRIPEKISEGLGVLKSQDEFFQRVTSL